MRRLRVLGPLEVDGAAEVLGPRDRVVVSALALRQGERVDAETLAEALWGEQPPASAAKVVQGCVSRLRKALGADAIETVDGGYRVRYDELDIDRQQFEDLVERARGYLATRTPERAIPLLSESLALWRGPAFGELEEWTPGRLEAVRLGQLRLAAEEDLLQARLDAGDHAGVATDGTVLTGQQPFRERRWALLALAQYRSGRQADALASIRAARRALGQELGLDPGSELVALESRILAQDPGLATDHEARLAGASCPWKGLAPYGDRDGDTFFGRDADIAACLARLEESPLLVVTGPSGSGKSSLVQAGLVPALRAGGADVEVFTPGADGALAMAAARSRRAGDPLLVIDQFEETFTLAGAGFARPWLGDVARYAEESGPVVVVVRGDHVAELGADADLARLAERGLHLVAPLAGDGLREAVEGPATVAGLRLEPGLVDLVVRDADGQSGALPLLSHALTETWRRRESGLLTVDGYRAAGGIREAVAASAERLYDGLSAAERAELRWLLLRLVSLSDSGEPFRTPLPASVAVALDPVRRRLLDLLVRGRLVTSRDGGYDLAHEALVRAWPRLRGWLDEDRVGQQIRRHLAMAATGWEALGRPEGELYRGARLASALDWLERGDEPLPDTERDFIGASRAVADEQVRRLAAETRRQRAQNRRLRVLVGCSALLLVAAAVAGLVAVDRGREATRGRDTARAAADSAQHESLVARSLALRRTNRAVAALLAVQAWREKPDHLAESALLGSLSASPGFLGYHPWDLGRNARATNVPGTNRVLAAAGSTIALVDGDTGDIVATLRRPWPYQDSNQWNLVGVSADGSRAVQALTPAPGSRCEPACSAFVVFDLHRRKPVLGPVSMPFPPADVAISKGGRLVVATSRTGADVATWDAVTGLRLARARLAGTAVAFGGVDQVYLGSTNGPVREVSAGDLRVVRRFAVPRMSANSRLVVTGRRLVAGGDRGQAVVDLRSGRRMWSVSRDRGDDAAACPVLAVSDVLGRSFCGSDSGAVIERELATGVATGRVLDPQLGAVTELAVTDRGHGLLAFGQGQTRFARWRLDGPGPGARVLVAGAVSEGGYDPSGRLLLVSHGRRTDVVDADGVTLRRLPPGRATWLAAGTVGVVAERPVLVDVRTGEVRPIQWDQNVRALYPENGGTHAWAVSAPASRDSRRFALRRLDLATGEPLGWTFYVEADEVPRLTSDGKKLLVTVRDDGTDEQWSTDEYDAASGYPFGGGIYRVSRVTIASDGTVIAAADDGTVREYISPFYENPDASFTAGGGSAATSVQVSSDQRRLAVTSSDQTVAVYDRASRTRLGDPVATDAPVGVVGAWLRPDGRALATNTSAGVVEWDLDPEAMVEAACALAGRNPTAFEWAASVSDPTQDRWICPDMPLEATPQHADE